MWCWSDVYFFFLLFSQKYRGYFHSKNFLHFVRVRDTAIDFFSKRPISGLSSILLQGRTCLYFFYFLIVYLLLTNNKHLITKYFQSFHHLRHGSKHHNILCFNLLVIIFKEIIKKKKKIASKCWKFFWILFNYVDGTRPLNLWTYFCMILSNISTCIIKILFQLWQLLFKQ